MDFFVRLGRVFTTDSTTIDNFVFRLHYKVTASILVAFSVLVACMQYFGEPINCISKDDIPSPLLDSFCFVESTFSILHSFKKKVGVEVPYPGIDKYSPGEERVYHTYYQWVSFVLFLQAILFYLPRHIWKVVEGGRTKKLIRGLDSPDLFEDTKSAKRKQLVQFMTSNRNNNSTSYFIGFLIAEIMNFTNVIGQIFLMNVFLGGELGSKIIEFTRMDHSAGQNPLIQVFPRLTKCLFHRYGHSGDVQWHHAVCLLPINAVNEKIYIFLWFWFVILAVLSGCMLVYRAATALLPQLKFMAIRVNGSLSRKDYLETFKRCSIGNWLILDILSENLDPVDFGRVLDDFALEKKGRALELLPS